MEYNGPVLLDKNSAIEGRPEMRVEKPQDLLIQSRPKTDRGGTTGESPRRLVRPTRKLTKLVTETSSKVREPKTYDEAIDDPIYRNKWRKAIDEEL